ncbi:Zn-ribbon domain-containing OB-fold protein [Cupriavidus pauculus]|uniref:Zn-ribbon domain-containing OB-fold protein n=1 Tax=Cupriavidus pauculus TaxID=82633 RepID=UPI001EE19933|nr:OB-fold domain-containing protein [Cupriavidus pauculus]GJG94738.1 OB-fold domain-containing protein [Cupriavidus pauculus]
MTAATTATSSLWSADSPPRLLASRHHATGEWLFPALPEHSPLASQHATVPVQGVGTVYSFTVIHPAPKTGQPPYALGYVDFDGPVRIFGRLQGNDRPVIGSRYAALPDDTYGYVFHALQD